LRLKDALESYEREQAAAATTAESQKNKSTGVVVESAKIGSSVDSASVDPVLESATVPATAPASDARVATDPATNNEVASNMTTSEAGSPSTESSTNPWIDPEESAQTTSIESAESKTAGIEANALPDADSSTEETIGDLLQQLPKNNPPPAPEQNLDYKPSPHPVPLPAPKPAPKAHKSPQSSGGGAATSPYSHSDNHAAGGGKCHWSNWQHKTVCGRRALMLDQASSPGWVAQIKASWASEYHAMMGTRSLSNIDHYSHSSSTSSGINSDITSTGLNQDMSLVLDLEDEADAAAEAAGEPESNPEHEVGTRARRLACK